MKKKLLRLQGVVCVLVLVVFLAPSLSHSQVPRLDLHFDTTSGKFTLCPYPFIPFNAYLILWNTNYYVTAVEYKLDVSDENFIVINRSYPPEYSIEWGDPLTGHSIAFWPPLNGFDGHMVICTMECLLMADCLDPGMTDYPIVVSPNSDSGYLRGTYAPDNELFAITGGTSYLCMHFTPPWLLYAAAESELTVRASFSKDVENWYEEYPGGSFVLETPTPGDTIWVVSALPIEESKKLYTLLLGTPLESGLDYTLYVTNACTNGSCQDCALDTRFDFHYEASTSTENSSWGRIKRLNSQ